MLRFAWYNILSFKGIVPTSKHWGEEMCTRVFDQSRSTVIRSFAVALCAVLAFSTLPLSAQETTTFPLGFEPSPPDWANFGSSPDLSEGLDTQISLHNWYHSNSSPSGGEIGAGAVQMYGANVNEAGTPDYDHLYGNEGEGNDWTYYGHRVENIYPYLFAGVLYGDSWGPDGGEIKVYDISSQGSEVAVEAPEDVQEYEGIGYSLVGDFIWWRENAGELIHQYQFFSGAPWYTHDPEGEDLSLSGRVHSWTLNEEGDQFDYSGDIKPSDPQEGAEFGRSVAVKNDLLAVGAPGYDGGRGKVYIYKQDYANQLWEEVQTLLAPEYLGDSPQFGWSVALSDRGLVVGAPYADPEGVSNAGAALYYDKQFQEESPFLFMVDEDGDMPLLPQTELTENANFGHGVAIDDPFISVGEPGAQVDGQEVGAVRNYIIRPSEIVSDPQYFPEGMYLMLPPGMETETGFGQEVDILQANPLDKNTRLVVTTGQPFLGDTDTGQSVVASELSWTQADLEIIEWTTSESGSGAAARGGIGARYFNIPGREIDEFTEFHYYRNGELITATTDTTVYDTVYEAGRYEYWLSAYYHQDGVEIFADEAWVVHWDGLVSAPEPAHHQPSSFTLDAPYPNPFNATTRVQFQTETVSDVTLMVYDLLGREVYRQNLGRFQPGNHTTAFQADGLPSGTYFARLNNGEYSSNTVKLLLLQ